MCARAGMARARAAALAALLLVAHLAVGAGALSLGFLTKVVPRAARKVSSCASAAARALPVKLSPTAEGSAPLARRWRAWRTSLRGRQTEYWMWPRVSTARAQRHWQAPTRGLAGTGGRLLPGCAWSSHLCTCCNLGLGAVERL